MDLENVVSYKDTEDNDTYGYSQKFIEEHFELENVSTNVFKYVTIILI